MLMMTVTMMMTAMMVKTKKQVLEKRVLWSSVPRTLRSGRESQECRNTLHSHGRLQYRQQLHKKLNT